MPQGEVMPMTAERIVEMMEQFDEVKKLIERPGDTINVKGKRLPIKSYWRRVARAFTLSTMILELNIQRNDKGKIISADCKARALHPSGAFADAYGGASVFESRDWNKDSDIPATAQTRAISRAISDLVAGGASTADEFTTDSVDSEGGTLDDDSLDSDLEFLK
jgi:hypothetical protein